MLVGALATTQAPAVSHPASGRTPAAAHNADTASCARPRIDDALAPVLARAVRSRAARLQRLLDADGRTQITSLGALNAALAQMQPDLTRPVPVGGGGVAPPPYVLPLTAAEFNATPTLDTAIARAQTVLWQNITVQEIVDDVNAMIATPIPVVVPVVPPAQINFENHGYKHFGGRPDLRVKQGGAQWTANANNGQLFMSTEIRRIEPALRAHANANSTEYYYTGDAGRNIGKTSGRMTSVYTIQITYNRTANTISYHGYPDESYAEQGLGYGRNNKQWQV